MHSLAPSTIKYESEKMIKNEDVPDNVATVTEWGMYDDVIAFEPPPQPPRKIRWFDTHGQRHDSVVAYTAVWSCGRRTPMVELPECGYYVLPMLFGYVTLDENDRYD